MNKKWLVSIPILLVLLSGLVSLAGCGIHGGGAYRTLTIDKGVAHFSFQYPLGYELGITRILEVTRSLLDYIEDSVSVGLWVLASHTVLEVHVEKAGERYANSGAALDDWIARRLEFEEDFEILERSTAMIDGVWGTKVICSYHPRFRGLNVEDYVARERVAYFDDGGLIYGISAESDEANSEKAQVDFDYILRSFQLLEARSQSEQTGNETDYEAFTLESPFVQFSFEHDSSYLLHSLDYPTDRYDINFNYLTVLLRKPSPEVEGSFTSVQVKIQHSIHEEANHRAPLGQWWFPPEDKFYHLLSREPVTVAGSLGEQIVYSEPERYPAGRKVAGYIHRVACFKAGGLDWCMQMTSKEADAEMDESDFEHMLQSFTIRGVDLEYREKAGSIIIK